MLLLTDQNYNGIVLSASRPYSNLLKLYRNNNIDVKKLFILDCISKSHGKGLEKAGNVLYLDGVSALTEISVSISKAIELIHYKKFMFIDSITTMLIYNKPDIFGKFIHVILTKMRINGVSGLLISLVNETNKEIRAEIAQLCDKVIKV